MSDLALIYIRAKDTDNNWGSFSLQELLEMGQIGQQQVASWLVDKLIAGIYQFKEKQQVDEQMVVDCLAKLDALGVPVIRVNPELMKAAKMNDPILKVASKKEGE